MKVMVAFLGKKNKGQKISNIKGKTKNNIYTRSDNIKKRIEDIKLQREFFSDNKRKKNVKWNINKVNKITDNSNNVVKFLGLHWYILGIIILFFIFCNIEGIDKFILNFATNFRQANTTKIDIADVMLMNGIYNKNNYIIDSTGLEEEKKEEVVTAKSENDIKIDIIDQAAKAYEDVEVFGKEDINTVVTQETKTLQRINLNTMKILNYSSKRDIDFKSILANDVTLTKKSDKILLYNTHTSESYINSEGYQFEYSGIMRSMDANYNMLAIASALNENLKSKGFDSIQNTTPHDYGTYTSAYAKSRITVKDALEKMGGAGLIIDVHRDAASDLNFAPSVDINGVKVAQLMLVMGVGSDTSKNPFWEENLKLAIKLQLLADKIYPGLFRSMYIRDSVYNQDLNKYSLLVEFGATGNTIDEVKLATRCLANLLQFSKKFK